MSEKKIWIVFTIGLILCILSGCGDSTPTGEMVNRQKSVTEQNEMLEIPVGSSQVKNEEQDTKKTFPILSELREERNWASATGLKYPCRKKNWNRKRAFRGICI